jgi:hypothetical protein
MKGIAIKKVIKWLAIILAGILLSGILNQDINILAVCMRLIGGSATIYTIVCIFKVKKQKEQNTYTPVEYSMMLLIGGVAFLLASLIEYNTLFNVIPGLWIIVIVISFIKLWKGAN